MKILFIIMVQVFGCMLLGASMSYLLTILSLEAYLRMGLAVFEYSASGQPDAQYLIPFMYF